MRALILIAGPSESGKSHATEYLHSRWETTKLKLVQILSDIHRNHGAETEQPDRAFEGWPFWIEQAAPEWLAARLGEWFADSIADDAVVTIESLYGPRMASILDSAVECPCQIWFIDAPRDARVVRQMHRETLGSLDEASQLLTRRDNDKLAAGLDDLRLRARLIENQGSLEEFHHALDQALMMFTKCHDKTLDGS